MYVMVVYCVCGVLYVMVVYCACGVLYVMVVYCMLSMYVWHTCTMCTECILCNVY